MVRNDLRNVAIIAHVDHGKTTLVDALLRQSGAFRDNQAVAERVMDSGDIERERGITILAKNCSCTYKGVKINIVDTPGHADFGGEVERVLKMVNGVLLLVDAAEGCMPQTRFVLQKALQQNLSLVVAINKIDRPDARIKEVIDEVLYLLMDLGATDEQLECPILFCCGRDGTASLDPDVPGTDLIPLFDTLLSTIKPPEGDPEAPFQMLVSSVDYNDFVGRIGIGRIQNGVAKVGEEVVVCDWHNPDLKMRGRLTKLYDFQANGRQPCDNITAGDIVAFSGLPDVTIGNTLCSPSNVEPLPFVKINDPTVEMTFSVNDSPLAGREGKYVTSRQIRDRLQKELLKDVALKVEDSPTTDSFRVMGRGEMHLSILIETMRRGALRIAGAGRRPDRPPRHQRSGLRLCAGKLQRLCGGQRGGGEHHRRAAGRAKGTAHRCHPGFGGIRCRFAGGRTAHPCRSQPLCPCHPARTADRKYIIRNKEKS